INPNHSCNSTSQVNSAHLSGISIWSNKNLRGPEYLSVLNGVTAIPTFSKQRNALGMCDADVISRYLPCGATLSNTGFTKAAFSCVFLECASIHITESGIPS